MSPGSSTFSSYCCCALISVTTVALILSSGLLSTAGALSPRSTYNCQKAMCNYGLMECSCQWHTSLDLQSRQYSPHPKFQTSHYPCTTRDFEEAMEKLRPFITSLGSDLAETCYDSNESPLLRAKRKTKPSHKPSRKKKHVSLPASEHPLSKSRKFYDDAFLYVVKIKKNKSAKKFTNFGGEVTTTLQPSTDFDATTALTVSDNGTDMESENRSRRSIPISSGDVWSAFSKPKGVTWRLDTAYSDPSGLLTAAVQRDIITQALGTWERSSNLCFREDTTSQSVNFVIQFRPAIHGFHNFAGTPAHTKSKQYIHLNRDFQWKLDARSTNGANSAVLRTVLEHEIGHLSGMSHSSSSAVMASNYNTQGDPSILSDSDLIELKSTYGRCTGKFYTLIDVQWRTVYPDGNIGLFYRSLITKETLVWQYSNQEGRPTDGYPTQVDLEFPSFLGTPTAVFQVYTYEAPKYIDDVFLIRGNFYQKYISKSHGLTYTGESGTVSKFDIPNSASVDAAVYDTRTERILFFVSSNVYEVEPVYNANGFVSSYRRTGTFTIAQMFPAAAGQNTGYMSGIDAVYIHVTGKMYLLKGLNIWRNVGFSLTGKVTNSIQYLGTQSDSNNDHLWDFLCNPFTCKSG